MYENVIVPFDGSLPARAVLAPAGDLAWRCGARIVIVSNTEASDLASKEALKSRAMSLSGQDVDFWVDLDHDLGTALLEAAKHRADPVLAIPVRTRTAGIRRRQLMGSMPAKVLLEAEVPVVVIGPETDVSNGLPLTEVVVAIDGSPESEQALPVAVDWACTLKIPLVIVGVVPASGGAADHTAELDYLRGRLDVVADQVAQASCELIEAADPATGLVGFLSDRAGSVIVMSTHGRDGVDDRPLGSVAQGVLLGSPRAMVFRHPR